MNSFYYFIFLFLLFIGCNKSSSNYQRSEHSKIAEKITAKTSQKIESETGLTLIGVGGGMMGSVYMMSMSFEYRGELNIEQGRELLIYCANEYLTAINEDIKLRPYLVHFPFTPKDIEIAIYIKRSDGKDIPLGAFSVISEIDGVLKYKIREPFPEVLRIVHEETYEEAVKILETEGAINKVRKSLLHI